MSNPPPPSIPGGTPPPPSIPTPPAAPSVPKAPAAPAVPPVAAAPAAPAAPPAAAAPTIPLRPAGLGGGIKLGGGLKTVALGSATTPVAPVVPPAGAAPAAAAPTVPLTPPGAGMATAQLPQATIGLNTAPAASPVSSASFTARKFQEDTDAAPSTLLNVLSFVALAFALVFIGSLSFANKLFFGGQGCPPGTPLSRLCTVSFYHSNKLISMIKSVVF